MAVIIGGAAASPSLSVTLGNLNSFGDNRYRGPVVQVRFPELTVMYQPGAVAPRLVNITDAASGDAFRFLVSDGVPVSDGTPGTRCRVSFDGAALLVKLGSGPERRVAIDPTAVPDGANAPAAAPARSLKDRFPMVTFDESRGPITVDNHPDTSIGEGAVIVGPVTIERSRIDAGATVSGSNLERCIIGPNAHVERSQLERTGVGAGARVSNCQFERVEVAAGAVVTNEAAERRQYSQRVDLGAEVSSPAPALTSSNVPSAAPPTLVDAEYSNDFAGRFKYFSGRSLPYVLAEQGGGPNNQNVYTPVLLAHEDLRREQAGQGFAALQAKGLLPPNAVLREFGYGGAYVEDQTTLRPVKYYPVYYAQGGPVQFAGQTVWAPAPA